MTFLGLDAHEWWVMGTGIVCAVACAIPGCFLVLKRMSMLGDAISHAILPGLAIAFLLTGTRDVAPMLAGAMAVGMLTALLTAWLSRLGRVPEDASMGVVFTSLFALGVILISLVASRVDLDANCVFYGLLEGVAAPAYMREVAGLMIPKSFLVLSVMMLLNAGVVTLFWKELKIASFDPALATTMGISAALVHYALMGMVAATTVVSFEAVGSILVVAMLIGPGATAHLLTDRLWSMVVIAAAIAALCAVAGFLLALALGTTIAGAISVCVGAAFLLAALLSPRHGIVSRVASRLALAVRIAREDILGVLYRAEEGEHAIDAPAAIAELSRGPVGRAALWTMRRRGLIAASSGGVSLTDPGRQEAARVVRSHRLWESFLSKEFDVPLDHLHDPSHRIEHFITPEVERDLTRRVGDRDDPHGKRIPD